MRNNNTRHLVQDTAVPAVQSCQRLSTETEAVSYSCDGRVTLLLRWAGDRLNNNTGYQRTLAAEPGDLSALGIVQGGEGVRGAAYSALVKSLLSTTAYCLHRLSDSMIKQQTDKARDSPAPDPSSSVNTHPQPALLLQPPTGRRAAPAISRRPTEA